MTRVLSRSVTYAPLSAPGAFDLAQQFARPIRSSTDGREGRMGQRLRSRLAFAVALAWMGFSPRCASLLTLVEASAMPSAD
jgi:hypothetical protein